MEIEVVKIDKTIIECGVNELITFRFSNLNNYNVSVTFYEEVWVDGQCKQDGFSEENYRELSLKSNEIISGSCSFADSFYIGSKIKRGNKTMVLTHFDLKNISVIVNEAGGKITDLTRLTWYVTDKAEYVSNQKKVGEVYRKILGNHFPAMTMVVVSALVEDEALIEIEATAIIPN
jgi:enamine deaminase RidA (YjgF/YER057c/UK114 family)